MSQDRQYIFDVDQAKAQRCIFIWLGILAVLIVSIVMLGGYTRLTGSGLSIVKWAPLSGIIPPLSDLAWQHEFDQYKMFPEYQVINNTLTLKEFKFIFMIEFLHRILGRVIGLSMVIPMIYFYYKRYITKQDFFKYLGMSVTIALQGFIGWYMVKSGLDKNPHVSHYRLGAHLILAAVLYSFVIWQMIPSSSSNNLSLKFKLLWLLGIIYLQIFFGAMVAGLKAGLIYNTFPLMGQTFVPFELKILDLNDAVTVQFIHRILAYIVFALSLYFSKNLYEQHKYLALIIVAVCLMQLSLGVLTLVYSVPIFLGLAHQLGALMLITCVLYAIKRV
jgi:cytochrome c oxidase assembly protein subunit 15